MVDRHRNADLVRHMTSRDLKTVAAIAQQCFGQDAGAVAWFKTLMKTEDMIGWVIERSGELVGYCFVQLYDRAMNIIQMAVDPKHHRSQVGENLVYFLKEKIGAGGRGGIVTFIPDDAVELHLFFRWLGFVRVDEAFGNSPSAGQYMFQYPAPEGCWAKARQGVTHR